MLKTTYKKAENEEPPSLPQGWTEHKAPSGHPYYYNAETQQSTYTRPSAPVQSLPPPEPVWSQFQQPPYPTPFSAPHAAHASPDQDYARRPDRKPRREPDDRPKSKHLIPGCAPWVLVKTKLGRRFVHNPDTNESIWKFPKDVIGGVVEFDIQERKKREGVEHAEATGNSLEQEREPSEEQTKADAGPEPAVEPKDLPDNAAERKAGYESDEYEEVEVTDDEAEEDEGANDAANRTKRQKTSQEPEDDRPLEFGEDDMAYQLAQMGETYELDPGEYGDEEGDWEDGAGGLEMTDEEARASFRDLLDDFQINPYTTWDAVVSEGRIIEDDRYTLLPNMKSRRDVFAAWSAAKIAQLKQEKESQAKRDPRVGYVDLLSRHATPKLYWPEFRRKFKKEPEMKDSKLSDKEREKLYREHVNRVTKLPESSLKDDLRALLKSIPVSEEWHRGTSVDGALPSALLADLRYISLRPSVREGIMLSFIESLPAANEASARGHEAPSGQLSDEQRRVDEALKKRERQVRKDRMRQEKQLRYGKGLMMEEERELAKATRVGKDGLKSNIDSRHADGDR